MARDFRNRPPPPPDAAARRAAPPVVCYPVAGLPPVDPGFCAAVADGAAVVETVIVPPRDGRAFRVPAGHLFRIRCVQGPQVGDLNLWHAQDLTERFYSGKTRQLQASHLTTGDRLWSSLPHLRPLATIVADSLGWYGWDDDGAGVHDVIGTRCDPHTNRLLTGADYHHCCHANLTRALAAATGLPLAEAEAHVHDVMNVFMCTGFTRDSHQYFMKASPVRPGDAITFLAEIDLLGALSACPGGDCGSGHSDDRAACFPLQVEILRPRPEALQGWVPAEPSTYSAPARLEV
ncbi:urea carboxylase-associated family protein [Marinibaculum pumilum]|uniref:Urea carboxylase-associated family protein n=1 Tax=Marinibaculum pumilum TaxID=1766165 RepID=A0ABV7L7G0_9PROT